MKIDVSTGEVVDKVTILSIKLEKITDRRKTDNVQLEYDLLIAEMEKLGITPESPEFIELKEVNLRIWDIEDRIRKLEAAGDFGEEFIRCARGVYMQNDRRAAMKRKISMQTDSMIMEEKEYTEYGKDRLQ